MPGRSGKTIDLCIPTMSGRSTSSFHRTGRHCVHQARSARGYILVSGKFAVGRTFFFTVLGTVNCLVK